MFDSVTDLPNLLPQQGVVQYHPDFVDPQTAQELFQDFMQHIPWREEEIVLFGKKVMQPRMFSWHADSGLTYKYSGLLLLPVPWTPQLIQIKTMVESLCGESFNSVLVNLYRHEKDSNGWHADDEKELGEAPSIASVSFGETRDFLMKHKQRKDLSLKLPLASGSLLLMRGETQKFWKHSIPKRSRSLGPRINLTFRTIQV